MKIVKEAKIGISALVVLVILYWGINFLKGLDIFVSRTVYYMEVNSVSGMEVSTAIEIRGVKVGSITNIEMTSLTDKIVVEFVMNSDYDIPNDSYLKLEEGALMSSPILKLVVGTSDVNYKSDDFLPFEFVPTMMQSINLLFDKVFSVLDKVDTLMVGANKILSDSTINNVTTMIEDVSLASKDMSSIMNSQKARMGRILTNIENITVTFNEAGPELKAALENFNTLSSEVKVSLPQMINEVNEILAKIQSPEGSIGKLLTRDELYNSLDEMLGNISLILADLKTNPSKYIDISVFEKLTPREKEDRRLEKIEIKRERKAKK